MSIPVLVSSPSTSGNPSLQREPGISFHPKEACLSLGDKEVQGTLNKAEGHDISGTEV